jgi:hypothetical protein
MQDIYKSWKVKGRKVSKTSSPMIGMVYEGVERYRGNPTLGVLVAIYEENDEAILRVRGGVLVSVDSTSLRVVTV